jgi:hypothetical protein
MPQLSKIRRPFALPALLTALLVFYAATLCFAQDDPNETPLGDVARSFRKKNPAPGQVIDDDNLSSVMQQAETRRASESSPKFLIDRVDKGSHGSAPDVTCSLSFASNLKALLSPNQYSQMNLPVNEISKLEGPATIEGDALTVSVLNGTSWHLSELAVALTIIRKSADASASYGTARLVPVVAGNLQQGSKVRPDEVPPNEFRPDEVRPEKKPDETIIYRMRAAAPPWSTTVFSASLNEEINPGEEWHWAIVEAKGYPPQNYSANNTPPAADPTRPNDPPNPSTPVPSQNAAVPTLPQQPQ